MCALFGRMKNANALTKCIATGPVYIFTWVVFNKSREKPDAGVKRRSVF
jgi:hypothetical protein